MNRSTSIRRRLLSNLIAIIVLITTAIMMSTFFTSRRIVRTLSASIISQTLEQTEDRLRRFFDPVQTEIRMIQRWGETGMLDLDKPRELIRLLMPTMRAHRQVTSMLIADDRGREQMILRIGDRWRVRRTRKDEWGDKVTWIEWTDADSKITERQEVFEYEPRQRPWYIGAMGRRIDGADAGDQPVFWTTPYLFRTTGEPGITASSTFTAPDGRTCVVGFDVLLNDISEYTVNLAVREHGMVVVLTADGRMIGLPADPRFKDPAAREALLLKRPEEIGTQFSIDSNAAFNKHAPYDMGPFRFDSEGQRWWGMWKPTSLSSSRMFITSVVVPESDVTGSLTELRLVILAILVFVLLGAIWRAQAMAKRFSRPIESLVRESERISRGDLEAHGTVRSDIKEVRRLADAHDQMRHGLQELMKLERDLQLAQQIQQQTFPDLLPQLKGFSIEAWSESADTTGGDAFDVIGLRRGEVVVADDRADRAVLLLADATGHGIGPALSVSQVRAILRMAVRMDEDLESIVYHMNEQLCADLPEGRFVTTWLGSLDAAACELTTYSAGQGPLLYYQAATGECRKCEADDMPLGVVPEFDVNLGDPIKMQRGDIYAVISDGIYEAADAQRQQFGVDRAMDVIREHHARSPAQILDALRAAVDAFTGGAAADDDRTVIFIKCGG